MSIITFYKVAKVVKYLFGYTLIFFFTLFVFCVFMTMSGSIQLKYTVPFILFYTSNIIGFLFQSLVVHLVDESDTLKAAEKESVINEKH